MVPQPFRCALAHLEACQRVLDPAYPLEWGHEQEVAKVLCQEAARRALLIRLSLAEESVSLSELLSLPEEQLSSLLSKDAWGRLRLLASAHCTGEDLRRAVEVVEHLLEEPARRLREDRVDHTRRLLLGAGGMLGVLLLLALLRAAWPRNNLAQGKPWRASSAAARCRPAEGRCGEEKTAILFLTKQEASPWFEVDLQQRHLVQKVRVKNRSDGFQERAVPLVLELSEDGKVWRQVARQEEVFSTWEVPVPMLVTRYVRLRVDRVSTLHLESVEVY